SGSTRIDYSLNSAANTTFRVEFFASSMADPSGYGEGTTFIGAVDVTTGATGHFRDFLDLPVEVASGQFISATVTDTNGNTSEFSDSRLAITAADLADLAVSMTANPDPATLGGSLTYTITIQNNGPGASSQVGLGFSLNDDPPRYAVTS